MLVYQRVVDLAVALLFQRQLNSMPQEPNQKLWRMLDSWTVLEGLHTFEGRSTFLPETLAQVDLSHETCFRGQIA